MKKSLVLFLLLLIETPWSSAEIKELQSAEEIKKFKSQTGTNGIFYYKKNINDPKPIRSK